MPVCAAPPFASELAVSCDERWRAHDLLRLRSLTAFDGEPAWVRGAFERAPYAVVRRALSAHGVVAIGVRGAGRSQRYGTWTASTEIVEVVAPEALVFREPPRARATLPAFVALAGLRRNPCCPLNALVWGPSGSVGFELATCTDAVTPSSDLDLLIRTPERLSRELAGNLLNHLQTVALETGIRIDAQLETPAGGVALAEWATGKARVLVRHASGPRLAADPWSSTRETVM